MSFKKAKTGDSSTLTIRHLLETRAGQIPTLAWDNEPMQSSAHVEGTGHIAAARIMNNEEPSISELLQSGVIDTNYVESRQSILLNHLGKQPNLVYQNETEVQTYVSETLRDAITTLGVDDVLIVRPEISLFSYRPDIIVVTHSNFGIILTVEVKKPGAAVFTSHSVAGQVYDYLVGMLGWSAS